MKRLFFPLAILAIYTALPGCYSSDEYFFGARPDSTGIERNVELINDHYQIKSKVFYRNFESSLGLKVASSMKYEHIKSKADGTILVMGSSQIDDSGTAERFAFATDADFSNLSTVTSLPSSPNQENYFIGPSDDFWLVEDGSFNSGTSSWTVNISRNNESIGSIDQYSTKQKPAWYLDASDNVYNLEVVDNFNGTGVKRVYLNKPSTPQHYWFFSPQYIRYPGFMIGQTAYILGVKNSSNLDVYKSNNVEKYRDSEEVMYGFDQILTSNVNCFGHIYQTVVKEKIAYILAIEYNKFNLVKFDSETNTLTQVATFTGDFPNKYGGLQIKLSNTGSAFLMISNGYGNSELGEVVNSYEVFKLSATETKSYGVVYLEDFDSAIPFTYQDFFVVNDEPVLFFSSGSGYTYSDHLLVVTPQ